MSDVILAVRHSGTSTRYEYEVRRLLGGIRAICQHICTCLTDHAELKENLLLHSNAHTNISRCSLTQ